MSDLLDRVSERVDPRIDARRRAVHAERRRRQRRTAVALAVVTGLVAAVWGASRSSVADVDHVEVVGVVNLRPDEVTAAAGVSIGDPLLDIDTGAVARSVESIPWVAKAQVVRSWRDGRVTIEVLERAPVAVVDHGGSFSVLDVGAKVLGTSSRHPSDRLPTITGVAPVEPGETLEDAVAAVDVAVALPEALRSHVASIAVVDGSPELALEPQGSVRLCDASDIDVKVQTVATVLAEVDLTDLAVIDVCVPDTAVLTREVQ